MARADGASALFTRRPLATDIPIDGSSHSLVGPTNSPRALLADTNRAGKTKTTITNNSLSRTDLSEQFVHRYKIQPQNGILNVGLDAFECGPPDNPSLFTLHSSYLTV
jgi:hypothetical protein